MIAEMYWNDLYCTCTHDYILYIYIYIYIYIYTGMFPVGDTISGTLIAVCVCVSVCVCVCVCPCVRVSADISLYCAKNDLTYYPEIVWVCWV